MRKFINVRDQASRIVNAAMLGVAAAAVASSAFAADLGALPTKKEPPPPVAPAPLPFFVRVGLVYGVNSSSSSLLSQIPLSLAPFAASPNQILLSGVNAKIADVLTVGLEAGVFVTPNVSLEVAAAIPQWATNKITGANVFAPASGTRLASIMPSFIPFTANYHFTSLGSFQPYLGAGLAPVFSFRQSDGYNVNVTVDPSIGLVLQGGADYMIDQHWGLSFDVKKLFSYNVSHATAQNTAFGQLPLASTQETHFTPWILSTGLTYRF